ncbi:MAG TPA: ABC transporter substrate-binding protein [Acidimicrobiales bacterium]|nr:ABC transporter substrate-binding protein [Acidimicrobiales bacterium]
MAAAVLLLAAVATSCGDDDDAAVARDDAQDEGQPSDRAEAAAGEPIRIGIVSPGKTAASDLSIELAVAEATVDYLNQQRGGIAGRPIELRACESQGDPSKAADCSAQMVQDEVVAVVAGNTQNVETLVPQLRDAGIPVVFYGASGSIVEDDSTVFVLANSLAGLIDLPLDVAKEEDADKVMAVVPDVPAAVDIYENMAPPVFEEAGIEIDQVAIPLGTADMTPQMQQIADDDWGVVHVIGTDAFCISALNGLTAAGYEGRITMVSQCLSDATREAVGDTLEGILMSVPAPLDADLEDIQLYKDLMAEYGSDIDVSDAFGIALYTALAGLEAALDGASGDITPAVVIDTLRTMPEMPLPGSGGLDFRCNGKAVPSAPAICTRAALMAELDAEGYPADYLTVNDTPIED